MAPLDWLLLFVAYDGAPEGLDPVRVQKGMFLFAKEGGVPDKEQYTFEPYNYGPMSKAIYRDLDRLVSDDFLEAHEVRGQTWSRYTPSNRGIEQAHKLIHSLDPVPGRKLYAIKQQVASQTFEELLEDVYEAYPDYAEKSVFRRRAERNQVF